MPLSRYSRSIALIATVELLLCTAGLRGAAAAPTEMPPLDSSGVPRRELLPPEVPARDEGSRSHSMLGPWADADAQGVSSQPMAPLAGTRGVFGSPLNAAEKALDATLARLRTHALETGTTRAIVGLNIRWAPEGELALSEVERQRQDIADLQASLLQELDGTGTEVIWKYQYVPFVALRLTAAGIEALRESRLVASIEEDVPMRLALIASVPLIQANLAWAEGRDGEGTVLAVVDTGVDFTHMFLSGKSAGEACFSSAGHCPNGTSAQFGAGAAIPCDFFLNRAECAHGTGVAGIVAGRGANFSGVARGARILAIRVASQSWDLNECSGTGQYPCLQLYDCDFLRALEHVWSLSSTIAIAAVNFSAGGGTYSSTYVCDNKKPSLKATIDLLRSHGIATVVASGNDGNTNAIAFPACISSSVSVGATTKTDVLWPDSNIAPFLSLLAPGVDITTSQPGNQFSGGSGTSYAAPHVAGAWAILKQDRPSATVTDVLQALASTGQPITDPRNGLVKPRIKIRAALDALRGPLSASLTAAPASGPAPLNVDLTAGVSGSSGTINYTFWWNCSDPGTNISQVMAACGSIPATCTATSIGIKCDAQGSTTKALTHVYSAAGNFTAKLIVERGSAATEQRAAVSVGSACTDAYEPNETSGSAWGPLSSGLTILPRICTPLDVDWFRVQVAAGGTLSTVMTPPAGRNYDLELYGPEGYWLQGSYNPAGQQELIQYAATTPGTYTLRVYGVPFGNGSYDATNPYALTYVLLGGGGAPVVNITTPTSTGSWSTTQTPLTIAGTATDDGSVTQVRWVSTCSGCPVYSNVAAFNAPQWSASVPLGNGLNVVTVTAFDHAGQNGSASLNVTYGPPDTTPPTIAITEPTTSPTYVATSNPITLRGTAADTGSGIATVSWISDRGFGNAASGTTNWTAAGITLLNGLNNITVTAVDGAGNTRSATLAVSLAVADPTPPQVSIISPPGSTVSTAAAQIRVSGWASDNVGVAWVRWFSDRLGFGSAHGTTDWWVDVPLVEGMNVIQVNAYDLGGLASNTARVDVTRLDTQGPQIQIQSPTSSPTYVTASSPLALAGTAIDSSGVASVSWANDRGGAGPASGANNWSVAAVALQSGANVITVTARDTANNASTATLTVVYSPPSSGDVSWLARAPLPQASHAPDASATVGGRIYVMGTYFNNDLWAYDPGTDTWQSKTGSPDGGPWDGGAGVINGKIYTVGNTSNYKLRIYDPATDSWSTAPAGVPRRYPAVVAEGERLYVIGGYDNTNEPTSLVERYDPVAGIWSTLAPLPLPRAQAAVTALGGRIYVFGGATPGGGTSSQEIQVYDPSTGAWSLQPVCPEGPAYRGGHRAVALGGKVYLIGTREIGSTDAVFEEYGPQTRYLRTLSPPTFPSWRPAAETVGGKLYVIGGQGALTAVQEGTLSPDTTAPTVAITAPTNGTSWATNIATFTLRALGVDNVGLVEAEWVSDRGHASGPWILAAPCQPGAIVVPPKSQNMTFPDVPLEVGVNAVSVRLRDSTGLQGTDTLNVIYTPPVTPTLDAFSIDGGAATTTSRTVRLDNAASHLPWEYLASEDPAFVGATWKPYAPAPLFELSSANGPKTVHLKVRNGAGESNVLSAGIGLDAASGGVDAFATPVLVPGIEALHALAVSPTGTVHVLGHAGTELHLLRSSDGGATFGPPTVVATGVNSVAQPDLAFSADGTLHAVWERGGWTGQEIDYARSTDGGSSFSTPRALRTGVSYSGYRATAASWPRLASSADGTVWVAFTGVTYDSTNAWRGENVWVTRSTDGGTTFAPEAPWSGIVSSQRKLRRATACGTDLCVLVIDDSAHVLVVRGSAASLVDRAVRVDTAGTYGGADLVFAPSALSAWVAYPDGPTRLTLVRSFDSGSTWSDRVAVAGGQLVQEDPTVLLDHLGSLHTAWSATATSQDVRQPWYTYSSDGGGTHAPARRAFASPTVPYHDVRLALDRVTSRLYLSAAELFSRAVYLTSGSVAPDAQAPMVTITSPTGGPTYVTNASTIALGGTAQDPAGVRQVWWASDRGGNGPATGTAAWSTDAIPLAEGDNVLSVTAVDPSGNRGIDTLRVTYLPPDTTPPSIQITSPTSAPTYVANTPTIVLGGTAADDVGVAQVRWSTNTGGAGGATGTATWTTPPIALQSGTTVITVTAFDSSGNTQADDLTVTYVAPDLTPPAVAIIEPTSAPDLTTIDDAVDLGGIASDDTGVVEVRWNTAHGASGVAVGTTNWSATAVPLLLGQNQLVITARDAAGNNGSDSLNVQRVLPEADLSVTKSDGSATAVPGHAVIYTIVVTNTGPSVVTGATVTDVLPSVLTGGSWTCAASSGSSCTAGPVAGNIADRVNLLAGGALTYTLTGTVTPDATGSLTNTAAVSVPASVSDPNPANNSATDTDTLTPHSDLAIAKSDGSTTAVPGHAVTYTISVTNTGPSVVTGAAVTDVLPSGLTGGIWTCTASSGSSCTGGPVAGNIADNVNLLVGGTLTYTLAGTVAPDATGSLTNTAVVSVPGSVSDPNPANNSATDTDTLTPQADLAITKSDGSGTAVPGQTVTYTISVANAGPSAVTGASVSDALPGVLTGAAWTCVASGGSSCTAGPVSGNVADTVNLLVGGTLTYTLTGTVAPGATGALANTATASVPGSVSDPNPANNSAMDTDTLTPQADLGIAKSDGSGTAVPGQSVTYTISVTSAGPSVVTGATVTDALSSVLTGGIWTCAASSGSSCAAGPVSGNIADTVNLLVGGTLTYTLTGTIAPGATGTLANTATVSVPASASDPNPANNSATDTDTLTPQADLGIAKSDGSGTAVPGQSVTYTITVTNAGPSAVSGASVTDALPGALTGGSWTCVASGGSSCAAGPVSGNVADTVNLLVGGTLTYTLTGTVAPGATGALANTATVSVPGSVSDPNPANDSATDTDTLTPQADLAIAKSDGSGTAVPGQSVTYTISVTNAGPSVVTGATVTDVLSSALTGGSWTCAASSGSSCTAGPVAGNIADTVTLQVGGTLTYTLTGTVAPGVTGTLANTATVSAPGSASDPNPANNSATDTDTLTPEADLAIAKSDGSGTAVPGQSVTYTISVTNAGPSVVTGATVTDVWPPVLTGGSWTCAASSGSSCTAGPVAGNIADTVTLLVGGTLTYTLTGTVAPGATGTLANTATVSAPGSASDPNLANNSATDTDTLTPQADLGIAKSDGSATAVPGQVVTYTISVANTGPSVVTGATVTDVLPSVLTGGSWTCVASSGSSCTAGPVAGNIADTVNLLAGGTLTYTLAGTIAPAATGTLANTATVSVPASVSDPNAANNSATDTDTLTPQTDLGITKSDGSATAIPGQAVTYTISVMNIGPSVVTGATVTDVLPSVLTGGSWTCAASSGSSCTAGPVAGNIADTVNLLAGGTLTYTLTGTVAPGATGALANTATVSVPGSASDPNLANNSATDTDTLTPQADLGITKSDGSGTAIPGQTVAYTITVTNAGPSAVTGATVGDALPGVLTGGTWMCVASSGSSCTAGPVAGNIADTVNLLAGGTLTYTLTGTVAPGATGTLANTATVGAPGSVSDPNPANNSATDTDTLTQEADLTVSQIDVPDPAPNTSYIAYSIAVGNNGPSLATDVILTGTLPSELAFVTATPGPPTCQHAAGVVTCALGSLAPGAGTDVRVVASIRAGIAGTVTNAVSVAGAPIDPVPGNNARSETTTVLSFSKGDINSDLQTDLIFRNANTGRNLTWLMHDVMRTDEVLVVPDPPSLEWRIAGTDDFNGDSRNDFVFWNAVTGAVEFWMMDGATRLGAPVPISGAPTLDTGWKLSATADFNHDGKPDILWRNVNSQKIVIWTLNGAAATGAIIPTPNQAADPNWQVVGALDWNGDSNVDFLWYNYSSGKIVLWFMDASMVRIAGQFTNPANAGDNNWNVLAVGDYGVGPAGLPNTKDIVWRNATSGKLVVWWMDQAGNRTSGTFTIPDSPTDPLQWTVVGPR